MAWPVQFNAVATIVGRVGRMTMIENYQIGPRSRNAKINPDAGGSGVIWPIDEDLVLEDVVHMEDAAKTLVLTEKDLISTDEDIDEAGICLLYTSPSPRDR